MMADDMWCTGYAWKGIKKWFWSPVLKGHRNMMLKTCGTIENKSVPRQKFKKKMNKRHWPKYNHETNSMTNQEKKCVKYDLWSLPFLKDINFLPLATLGIRWEIMALRNEKNDVTKFIAAGHYQFTASSTLTNCFRRSKYCPKSSTSLWPAPSTQRGSTARGQRS